MQGVSVSELHFNFPTTSALKELESHKNPINVLFRRFFSGRGQLAGRNGQCSPTRQGKAG